jgi:cytochrome c553
VLLTHTFGFTPSGAAEQEVCVRTLVVNDPALMPMVQLKTFGAGAALLAASSSSDDSRVACMVEVSGAAVSVSQLSPALRSALKQCRRAQVLSALASCMRCHWVGGTALLCDLAEPLLPPAAVQACLKPLALRLRVGFAGDDDDADTAAPTPKSCELRIQAAEALEAGGDFLAAAALY